MGGGIWRKRVGVENITDMNLKDLEEILGNTKSLKRNNKELEEILIVPSMFPCFHFDVQDSAIVNSTHTPNRVIGFRLKFRGTDGKPITEPFQETEVNLIGWDIYKLMNRI